MVTNTHSDDLLKAVLALPEAERLEIAGELLASVPPPPGVMCEGDPGFFEELDRRMVEYKKDPSTAVEWEVVRDRLNEKYGPGASE